jgi:uroporphyrinogen III methyltransferase / synthase
MPHANPPQMELAHTTRGIATEAMIMNDGAAGQTPTPPPVALVGAGPGNPSLLTLRAVECLATADLIVYDQLVPARLLDHARPGAKRVCVSDLAVSHRDRHPAVHDTLIEAARQGLRVVRLKGGDPFIFGRGAEEAEALRQAGIDFEVVPGVSAATGATAFAGIALTHRGLASAVALVAGHEQPGKSDGALDWDALARFPGTLVFFMGLTRLASISEELMAKGKNGDTPAAAVQWGSTGRQRTVEASLRELAAAVTAAGLASPTLIVIGDVVRLRSELAWFERRPLFGRSVLVTRPRGQEGDMMRRLEALGANVSLLPTIEIREIADWGAVDRAIDDLPSYGWLVFTSVNGVRAFLDRLRRLGKDLRALGHIKLAAIGPATARALREYHLEPDVVPSRYRSEGLIEALRDLVRGQRVLLARADRGRDLLRDELSAVADVEQVAVYSQVDVGDLDPLILADLRAGRVDFVTLTSSNIARALARALDEATRTHVRSGTTRLVSISSVTSAAISDEGLSVAAEAREETSDGLMAALIELAAAQRR